MVDKRMVSFGTPTSTYAKINLIAGAGFVWLFADSFIYRLSTGLPVLWRVRYLQVSSAG